MAGTLGATIEAGHLEAAVFEQMQQQDECQILSSRVDKIVPARNNVERPKVIMEDGTTIEPALIVGSDGADNFTRLQHKIPSSGYNYNQNALVCNIQTLQPNQTSYQRFLRTGPI